MKLNNRQIQHFYYRAGFGESLGVVRSSPRTSEKLFQSYLDKSQTYKPLGLQFDPIFYANAAGDKEKLKMMKKEERSKLKEVNGAWINNLGHGADALREKMTLFWHDHFACEPKRSDIALDYVEILRKHALGSFRDLLFAVSKSPAMIIYLNNKQNKKGAPNENFAREVMELFTLGIGNYSERDIKESAKAFTGWSSTREGEFVFRRRLHDYSDKSFMGKHGAFTGDDILNMLLDNKQTAIYICEKIYAYLVNEQIDKGRVASLAEAFYRSDYNISGLLESIFTADWFYDEDNIGNRIKSPIELLSSYQRCFYISFQKAEQMIFLQKVLGQMLLQPPNVAGWPGGRNWIDSSSLTFRIRLADIIFKAAENYVDQRQSIDDNDRLRANNRLGRIAVNINMDLLQKDYGTSKEEVDQYLGYAKEGNVNPDTTESTLDLINFYCKLPEYQLC